MTDAIDYLKGFQHWVVWRYETRDGKLTKVPKNPRGDGDNAKSNDAETWGTYDDATAAKDRYNFDGVGFMLAHDAVPLVGVDLDHCVEDGIVEGWAMSIVGRLKSYTEITPSGTGLRIFVFGDLPPTGRKKGDIEMYIDLRSLTVTGNHLAGTPKTIETRTTEILAIHLEVFGEPKSKSVVAKMPETVNNLADNELILKAQSAKNGSKFTDLWNGNIEGYPSESEADLALCSLLAFWTAGDEQRIDTLFCQSGLYREKWGRGDYKQMTIDKAKAGVTEVYSPNGNTRQAVKEGGPLPEDGDLQPTYTREYGRTIWNNPVRAKGEIIGYAPTTVADFTAKITEEITDEAGTRFFKIEGKTCQGTPFTLEISVEDFNYDNRLKAALGNVAGAKAPILANMSKHVGPSIQRFTTDVKLVRRYDRTGWVDDTFLVPGREPDGVTIHLPRKLPYSILQNTNFDAGLNALERLFFSASGELSTVALAFIFQPPLAHPAGWRETDRYALFLAGQTGTFKTSFMQCAMSIYGTGFFNDDALIRFGDGATKNAMQKYATHCHDLPFLIDNYKPSVPPGERGFYSLLHAIVEGGEKDRLTRQSELREARPIYAWPIFTGEDTPDKDPASLARVLKLDWFGGDPGYLSEAQAGAGKLSAVGCAWLTWLESTRGQKIVKDTSSSFLDGRRRWATLLKQNNENAQNIMRIASNLASNELTWQIMSHKESPLSTVLERYPALAIAHSAGLRYVAMSMADETSAALEATRYLEALQELLRAKNFEGQPGEYTELKVNYAQIGWQDTNNEFYLKPKQARKAVDDLLGPAGLGGVSNEKIYKQLVTLGLIARAGKNGTLYQKSIQGEKPKIVHLKSNALGLER